MLRAEQIKDTHLREVALSQAAHDLKGGSKPEDVVKRAAVYLTFLCAPVPSPSGVTNDQIRHMVERFLGWKLPADFSPDNGVSFQKPTGVNAAAHWPSGTNLLHYDQAFQMVRYITDNLPGA